MLILLAILMGKSPAIQTTTEALDTFWRTLVAHTDFQAPEATFGNSSSKDVEEIKIG